MWKAIPLTYRIGIVAVASAALIWGLWYAKGKYDSSIRSAERMACNAEWTVKNSEAQKLFDEVLEKSKTRQKAVKPSPSAAAFSNELQTGRAFNPFLAN